VAPYYDLSLQHASGPVLARMARSGDAERFLELIDGIRVRDPSATFRSSFIVGFPGETEADVLVLAQFLAEARLDWAGFFTYSAEEGTPAAAMPDQVDADEARARRDLLSEIAEAVADEQTLGWVGREVDVLVEGYEDGDGIGRCEREAPDTDGEVRLRGGAGIPVGRLVPARIVGADGVDLVAEPLARVRG
jgi:ribosomal protein S12 methylthiotransferase